MQPVTGFHVESVHSIPVFCPMAHPRTEGRPNTGGYNPQANGARTILRELSTSGLLRPPENGTRHYPPFRGTSMLGWDFEKTDPPSPTPAPPLLAPPRGRPREEGRSRREDRIIRPAVTSWVTPWDRPCMAGDPI